jgi:cytochrome c553
MEDRTMRLVQLLSIGALLGAVATAAATAAPQEAKSAAANRFIGAAKCKTCHASSESGDQFG